MRSTGAKYGAKYGFVLAAIKALGSSQKLLARRLRVGEQPRLRVRLRTHCFVNARRRVSVTAVRLRARAHQTG